ncbi:hypothetical protein [Halalkalicoccus sp. NIPERK01]|uniref:hypothetical protein n=1 Tax=Halalkalicoccus sp. NIPERK01 TaxID=3053469 RepID=UPI00256EE7BA|nr:hypothetical protein [Halalkalicoccus sp. NIPERK01]MDL5360732.1 hypothetical protein [Halalkalicoccus sp. NIPERK01]
MDCPQCGRTLSRYSFGERDAVGCEACGYVGVIADHTSAPRELESWDVALDRFRGR